MPAESVELKLSRYLVWSTSLPGNKERHIVYSTRTQRALLLSDSVYLATASGQFEKIPNDVVALMINAKMLVPIDCDELADIVSCSRAAISNCNVLYECIQPTSWCNFGCGYCGQDHSRGWMSAECQSNLLNKLRSKLGAGGYGTLRIGWFGAEPLMAWSVIESLSIRLRKLADEYGIAYEAHLITNGYALTPARMTELMLKLGVSRVEITIDGSPEKHDYRRPLKSGAGTFERVWRNLTEILKIATDQTAVVLRCNVDSDNADDVPLLIEAVGEIEGRKPHLYFAPVHDWTNDAGKNSLAREKYAQQEIDWLTMMIDYGLPVGLLPKAKPVICMAVTPHSNLTESNGMQRKCTEIALLPKLTKLPNYDFDSFITNVADKKLPCSNCEMLPVCGGACPKSWYDGKLPCPSAKLNLPDRLRLAYATSALQ